MEDHGHDEVAFGQARRHCASRDGQLIQDEGLVHGQLNSCDRSSGSNVQVF
jgi:hypothetical protein